MNNRIRELALEAGLLNYVDNETPRHYFVHADIEIEDIEKFAESIVRECIEVSQVGSITEDKLKRHFGVE